MADSTPLLLSRSESSNESKQPPPSLDETIEHCIESSVWPNSSKPSSCHLHGCLMHSKHSLVFSLMLSQHGTASAIHALQPPTFAIFLKNSWAWDNPNDSSIISEWGLQCASSIIRGLPASSFFMGCLIGGLMLATLADSMLGRKNLLFLSCLVMSFSGSFTIFSNNIWTYSALKFVNGFGRATIGTCALVLSTELVGKRWRSQVGVIVHFLVRESPRWLFVRGRKDEAVSILKSIATAGSSGILMSFSNLEFGKESWNVDTYSAIKILLKKKWACRRLLTVMALVFGIGLVYYGMPLGLANLSFNLYLSVTFNALSELPASLVTFFLVDKLNRKDSLLVFTTLSGVCSILSVVTGERSANLQMGLELVSFFSACTAFNISLIYTLELFPTCVRNSAISMARQSLVFGGMFSPVLVAAGSRNRFLSYGIFGMVIGICGLFVICLPETRGKTICDTMDEEEYNSTKIDLPVVG
ncbi:hypothetical protein OIU76_012104 [Salix suchowensis]|nr:hypothetical protein OIU76_012104 [Salix suchowensis]